MKYFFEEVSKLYEQGKSQKQISDELGCGLNTVRRRMKELKLGGKSKGIRNYQINESVFDNINTEEKAYWLGFLLADGCIAKSAKTRRAIKVSIQIRDKEHLLRLAKFFNFNGKYIFDKRNNHERIGFVFNSVRLCNKLIEYGWLEFKENGDTKILNINENLFSHLFRGYFDGDGCISNWINKKKTWYIHIVSNNRKPLEYFNSKVPVSSVVKDRINKKSGNKTYTIKWSGLNNVRSMIGYIYDNSNIYLKRKFIRCSNIDNDLFVFRSIHSFSFNGIKRTNDIDKIVCERLIESFSNILIDYGWSNPQFDYEYDINELKKFDINKCICENSLITVNGKTPGNDTILHFQSDIWKISQNSKPSIYELSNHKNIVIKAINQFFKQDNSSLSSTRLIRELQFAGFTKASILSVPVIMAAIKKFNLSGSWFDPCAGWGNRLLAAHILKIDYNCTDPGICYEGLKELSSNIKSTATVQNKKWQDAEWINCGFVLTSPPFWNKENYLDNVDYGTYDKWCGEFLFPLIEKSKQYSQNIVFHVDKRMISSISEKYNTEIVPLTSSNRHKMPTEYFIKINECI
jgi:hypothetical protein